MVKIYGETTHHICMSYQKVIMCNNSKIYLVQEKCLVSLSGEHVDYETNCDCKTVGEKC